MADMFRKRDFGDVEVEVNSKAMNQDRFIDQSRLTRRFTEDYVPSSVPGKPGKFVARTELASPTDNARISCDGMKHRSSFTDESVPANANRGGACCAPSPYYDDSGSLTRRRGATE